MEMKTQFIVQAQLHDGSWFDYSNVDQTEKDLRERLARIRREKRKGCVFRAVTRVTVDTELPE